MNKSLWHEQVSPCEKRGALKGHVRTDVLIIGGGLAGILCAYRLKKAGIDCVVAEKGTVGCGVTGNTTAKITAQHGIVYNKLIGKFGTEKAGQYYDANQKAVHEYEGLSEQIDFDFEKKTAFVYSINDMKKLESEINAYRILGIPSVFVDSPNIPVKTVGAVGMFGQAQMNPLKLLYALSGEVNVYEHTCIKDIKDGVAIGDEGKISARHIILATHFPMVNVPGLYFVKMYQHRSYVAAIKDDYNLDGMYVDENKKGHSFRRYKDYLIIGGGGHKTGTVGGGYDELERFISKVYPGRPIEYKWAAQDCMTLDDVPYIGIHHKSSSCLYTATGFNKWGMTGAMTSALVLEELILKGRSDYQNLFCPQRSIFHPQLLTNVASSAINFVTPGKRCTHLGCALKWNKQERTWDCPCHGSRFDKSGGVIDNPAKKDISV